MSVFDNINAIQARMRDIQSRFGCSGAGFNPVVGVGNFTQGTVKPTTSTPAGITFEQLLASKLNKSDGDSSNDILDALGAGMSADKTENVKKTTLPSKASDFDAIISEASQKFGVDEKFIKAIINQESGFNPNATSWVGAMGLMQLMPETAKSLGVKNAYDPKENIMGGVKYIKDQLSRFGGDKRKALAAYNAGPGAVMKYGGIPPYQETQNYVKSIMAHYKGLGGTE